MFGRARANEREQLAITQERERHEHELARLRVQLARLENALAEVITASDEVVGDLRLGETDPAGQEAAAHVVAGFAAEWTRVAPQHDRVSDTFFEVAETDTRARDWLLASS